MFDLSISKKYGQSILVGMGLLTILSILMGIFFETIFLYLTPAVLLVAFFAIFDFEKIYYLLLLFIPFTIQISLPGGFSTDLPGELLTILLMFIYLFYVFSKRHYPTQFIRHPLTQLIVLHVIWIAVSVIFAQKQFIAFKFLLAKLWYVITFVFITGLFIKDLVDFKKLFWVTFIPLLITVLVALMKQYAVGFNFDEVNRTVQPFYHNHVNYAAVLTLFFPFLWVAAGWYSKRSYVRYFLLLCRILFVIAIIYAYTRGAWLAIFCGLLFLLALHKKFVSWLFGTAIAALLVIGVHFIQNNKYLDYAPEYRKAVYHANISAHLKATIKIQDVSTAERFFRWIGGIRMSTVNPITGFGPSNFYHHYKHYTVTAFTTYVSENIEKSGVHNYFLMTVIEQGFVGLFIFLAMTLFIFYYGTNLFRRLPKGHERRLVAALLVSLIIIYVQLCLSDLVEAFKIGSFFFINIAVLVNLDLKYKNGHISQHKLPANSF